MTSRPRRSAATKAKETISVHARWADSPDTSERSDRNDRGTMSSRRSGRASGVSRDAPSSPGDSHLSLTVKVPSNKLREVTRGSNRRGEQFVGGEIVEGKRNRGAKKSYVVDSSPDDDDEEEDEEAEIEVEEDDDDDDLDDGDEDAEGEDDMEIDADGDDIDAEGEEDAEGDIDMDLVPPPPTIKVSRPAPKSKPAPRPSASKVIQDDDDDDDDDLSDPDSDLGDQTLGFGDETMADEDAEGEEIEVAGEEMDDEEEEAGSDDEGSSEDTPDVTKMTKRQRARFEDGPQEYMKLSDEVQVKKHFTAEELSMRRQEMARRRRNLSEKRNEEVKMETINKLLKKQAPKISRKAAAANAANADIPEEELNKANPVFVRWVSNKSGNMVAVPEEMLQGPVGKVFIKGGLVSGKMVQEVA